MKIGILGGGQLARMLAVSAKSMGIEIICIDPKKDCSAKKVTTVVHCDFDDLDEIENNFHDVDCVTYETENLPIETLEYIAKKYKLLPNVEILKVSQDRLFEKEFLNELNIPTAKYSKVETWENLKEFIDKMQFPVVLKTRKNGYDGKGQVAIRNLEEAIQAWQSMSKFKLIVEKFIPYSFEISLVSVRSHTGIALFYPLTLNQHKNGILQISQAPYIDEELKLIAEKYASSILEKFNYIGVMTVEFFCVNGELVVNEIAPRVHNSGHWTIDGAYTSQFENHIRAINALPLGKTASKGYSAMINLITKKPNIELFSDISGMHYHCYDKSALEHRKLGHITICHDNKKAVIKDLEKALNIIELSQ